MDNSRSVSAQVHSSSPGRPAGQDRSADGGETQAAVRAFQAGMDREGSFRILFARYYRPIQRFFARKGFSADLCLDLTQETFLGIYRGLEAYQHASRLETWMFRIATTTYLKHLRAAATQKREGQEVATEDEEGRDLLPSAAAGQLDDVLHAEKLATLRAAVEGLPEQMRRCLVLRIYHELGYREIAEVMRISVQTVKAHLFQARGKLKLQLAFPEEESS